MVSPVGQKIAVAISNSFYVIFGPISGSDKEKEVKNFHYSRFTKMFLKKSLKTVEARTV